MNKWVKKSIKLANSPKYLDKLTSIYPIEPSSLREIPNRIEEKIKNSFRRIDKMKLLQTLLKLKKFPIDNPYISTLRKHKELISRNKKTIGKIADQIIAIAIDKILDLAKQPKKISRGYGPVFRNWLQKNIGYPFLESEEFLKYNKIAFLKGDDEELKQFVSEKFRLEPSLDFIFKIKHRIYIGQAKFITEHGGGQKRQFDEAIKVAQIKKNNLKGIAVLDGILWFKNKTYMHRTVTKLKEVALSALLLKEFIKNFSK